MLSKLHLAVIEDLKSRVTYSVLLQKLAPDDAIEFILRQLDKVVSLSLFRHRANGRRRRTTSDHTIPRGHFSDGSAGITWISYDRNLVADYDVNLKVNIQTQSRLNLVSSIRDAKTLLRGACYSSPPPA